MIVVDDASSDDSVAILKSNFPSVRLVRRDTNGGFQAACNSGADVATQPLLYFIHNDMRLERGALDALAGNFADDTVFAVAARSVVETFGTGGSMRGGPWNESITRGALLRGWLELEYPGVVAGKNTAEAFPERRPVLYAPGGAVMCRADRFRALGGFDPIYAPYLFEDVDLSYTAWKRGWTVMYEPHALVHHEHSATIGKTSARSVRRIAARNQFLLHWKNLTGGAFIAHCLWILPRLMYWLVTGKPSYVEGFWRALGKTDDLRVRRKAERAFARLTDQEVLRRSSR